MNKIIIRTLYILLASLLISCQPDRAPKDEELVTGQNPETITGAEATKPKTNEELVADAIENTIATGIDVLKQLKVKDSIRFANREQVYAYQLGLPIRNDDEVFEIYKTLSETENIYVVKQSRKDFYLVYYNGYTEKQLKDSSEIFKSTLPNDLRNTVKVINLMTLCSKSKQKLMKDEALTKRKEEIEIPCLICEK